jgi:hypothetical protein
MPLRSLGVHASTHRLARQIKQVRVAFDLVDVWLLSRVPLDDDLRLDPHVNADRGASRLVARRHLHVDVLVRYSGRPTGRRRAEVPVRFDHAVEVEESRPACLVIGLPL